MCACVYMCIYVYIKNSYWVFIWTLDKPVVDVYFLPIGSFKD